MRKQKKDNKAAAKQLKEETRIATRKKKEADAQAKKALQEKLQIAQQIKKKLTEDTGLAKKTPKKKPAAKTAFRNKIVESQLLIEEEQPMAEGSRPRRQRKLPTHLQGYQIDIEWRGRLWL